VVLVYPLQLVGVIPDFLNWSDWGNQLAAQYDTWKIPAQFLVVFFIVSWVYFKIHGTYVAQLLKGVAVVLAFYLLAGVFGFTIISGILQAILQISIIGFIILFQPELRRLLVYLGQPDLFGKPGFSSGGKEKKSEFLVHELVESIRLLSKTKTGALIVLETANGIGGAYLEAGTQLDAKLSTELLLTIFHPNTPLHDGAVIISPENRIEAAGVLLPLSENPNLSWKYGTRHRAAIGLSEVSDSRCLVVSEETGNISMVFGGNIEKIASVEDLKRELEYLYGVSTEHGTGHKRHHLAELLSTDLFQKFFSKAGAQKKVSSGPSTEDRAKIG
jgi:diadenylate cyclase